MSKRICITGMGVRSAIGNSLGEFSSSLQSATSGVLPQTGIFPGQTVWAGLVSNSVAAEPGVDRSAVLAYHAGRDAWQQATGSDEPDLSRVALFLGTSHGGRSQIDACLEIHNGLESSNAAHRILKVSPHYRQTEWVAHQLGVHGPVSTISTACSSSSAAIVHGIRMLEADKADYVLAGGMDGFSKLTHSGFDALGAVADGACGPFSERLGISLGEGAAVVVLERLEDAEARHAHVWAELYGEGSSWDCYHLTEPHPCGDGLLRALEMAAKQSDLAEPLGFGYASLHGTGTRANDAAETIAIKRFFGGSTPPASSLKSFTGHTLGASGAMGLIASVLGMAEGFLPPTLNFETPRAGCDLDYVPNKARASDFQSFSSQSAGFGGVNLVLFGGRHKREMRPEVAAQDGPVAISGVGVVSAAGTGIKSFRESLLAAKSGIAVIDRFDVSNCRARFAGMVRDFFPRKLAPTLNLRRADLCFQYAAIAVAEALADAKLQARGIASERIGLVVGTTRGAVSSFERCMQGASGGAWKSVSALHFPNLVMSSLGGYVSNMFSLKGMASTLVCGNSGGLQAVIHAAQMLRGNDTQDAVVVVLADELSPLMYRYFDELGTLSSGSKSVAFSGQSTGSILGEGAAAFVLEKAVLSGPHRDRLIVRGSGLTCDSQPEGDLDMQGQWFAKAIRQAVCEAEVKPADVDLIFGHGTGCRCRDARELAALKQVVTVQVPLCCVSPNTGLAESASAGFSLAAAALALRHQEVYAMAGEPDAHWNFADTSARSSAIENILVTSSSEGGNNGALILSRTLAQRFGTPLPETIH